MRLLFAPSGYALHKMYYTLIIIKSKFKGSQMTLISKTEQTVGEARLTVAVNDDDVQAGYNDTAASINAPGGFLSFPSTASMGTLKWFASNNAGNYALNFTNASFGQATNFLVHDPANANGVLMIGGGTAPFVSGNIPVASGTSGLFVDSGVSVASFTGNAAIVTLTASQVNGAYATPVQLIAAPGSGKSIIILNAQIAVSVSTAFTAGGVGVVQYGNTIHGAGTNALTATTPAADITAATSQIYSQAGTGSVATTVTTGIGNTAVYFSNQTQAFATGTGSTLTFVLTYVVVPVAV